MFLKIKDFHNKETKMRKLGLYLLTLVLAVITGCSTASPDAGYAAVKVRKPWFFGHGGVESQPITTGQSYGALSTTFINVEMRPQRIDMPFDDMMTKSGVPVNFHVLFVVQVTDPVKLVSNYGVDQGNGEAKGAWNRVMDAQINQLVRDTIKQYDMQDIAINQVSVDEATAKIVTGATAIVKSSGMPLTLLSVNVGRVMPPDAVSHQRIETSAQEQRVITEQRRKLAEDARKAAEQSRAAADNAYREEMQLSPAQYVQLETIKMEQTVCSGGKCTFFVGGQPTPILDTNKH